MSIRKKTRGLPKRTEHGQHQEHHLETHLFVELAAN